MPSIPLSVDALLRHGLALHQAGDMTAAGQLYRKTLSIDPGAPDALHMLGIVERRAGNLALACNLLIRAQACRSDLWGLQENIASLCGQILVMAQAREQAGQGAEALPLLRQATKLAPANTSCWQFRGILAETAGLGGEAAEAWLSTANLARQAGNAERVLAYCQRAFNAAPMNVDVALRASRFMQADGKESAAFRLARAAVLAEPGSGLAWLRLSEILAENGHIDAALKTAYRAALSPEAYAAAGAHFNSVFRAQVRRDVLCDQFDPAAPYVQRYLRYRFGAGGGEIFVTRLTDLPGLALSDGALTSSTPPSDPVPADLLEACSEPVAQWLRLFEATRQSPVNRVALPDVEMVVDQARGPGHSDYTYQLYFARKNSLQLNGMIAAGEGNCGNIFRFPDMMRDVNFIDKNKYTEIFIEEECFLFPVNKNYSHFLIDIYPLLYYFQQLPENVFLFCIDLSPKQWELLDLAGVPRSRVLRAKDRMPAGSERAVFRFSRAHIGQMPPYPIGKRWIRDQVLSDRLPDAGAWPRRVYFSRRKSYPHHRVANEPAVIELLESMGFTVLSPEDLTVAETITLVNQAEVVISTMGSTCSNSVFLSPKGVWITIYSQAIFESLTIIGYLAALLLPYVGVWRPLLCGYPDPLAVSQRERTLFEELELHNKPVQVDLAALRALIETLAPS